MRLGAKHWVMGVAVGTALAGVAWAGSAWKDKKPSEWSEKDMDKFLTNSPWAMTVQPASGPQSMDQGAAGTGGGWGGGGGGGGGRGGGGGNMGGGMGGAMPIMTYQIWWVSAPIMREALKLADTDPLNAAIAKYASDYYIIGVTMHVEGGGGAGSGGGGGRGGRPGGGGGQMGAGGGGQGTGQGGGPGGWGGQSEGGHQRFEAMLIQGATLKFAHEAVHPAKAEMAQCKSGWTTLYMFPRSLKLEDVDKNYLFELTQGPSVTRAEFNLKGFEQAPDKGL